MGVSVGAGALCTSSTHIAASADSSLSIAAGRISPAAAWALVLGYPLARIGGALMGK